MQLQVLNVPEPKDLENAFQRARRKRVDVLNVVMTGWNNSHRPRLVNLAAKARLPTMYSSPDAVFEGGPMSYSADLVAQTRRATAYVDKILKGTKPADLPVEQPTKFEFIINLKTAKQIGLTIPPNVLTRADKVIK
jgi:putative tryptophan/tyrosine transport system substrate-binding protein